MGIDYCFLVYMGRNDKDNYEKYYNIAEDSFPRWHRLESTIYLRMIQPAFISHGL